MSMSFTLDRKKVRKYLENFDLRSLFIEELGWDHGGNDTEVVVADQSFTLQAIAQKRGMVAYQYAADSDAIFPDHPTRQKIEKALTKAVREHIIIYATPSKTVQYWQWIKRSPGLSNQSRLHIYHRGQPGESLIQRLERLVFTLNEEGNLTIVDVSGRVRAAFDVEKVTKRFYDQFQKEHTAFLSFIDGIKTLTDRKWYASLMLNRMMFIYFIQKRGFLDSDPNYLRNRLEGMQKEHSKYPFQAFYRLFLLRLFHEGLSRPVAERTSELWSLLGKVPYLNGGLFDVHDLEQSNEDIHIPDKAFENIFAFFDTYQWHLDDRPLHNDKEINPDVLGYIFEKHVNQKEMGAYYTKEDITGYISRNTIIPFLFEQTQKEYPIAFKPGGIVWRILQDNPDRYFHESIRHGITYDIHQNQHLTKKRALPQHIAAGLDDPSQRGDWNKPAPADYALPTETWREHIVRRQHYEAVWNMLADGKTVSINDIITYNLDIEKFVQDVLASGESPELIRAFWEAIKKISILDPTCGSGAFLFAALNILEPIYVTCLETMRGLIEDQKNSEHKHNPETMDYFHDMLNRVGSHASESYFIIKSIIVDNLYGVDIMKEAVEICKLRLFLKLVSQLETYDQIEPLPDIDFNIRVGNTLVGFASLTEIQETLRDDLAWKPSLQDIVEKAQTAGHAFHTFRKMQTNDDTNADDMAIAKSDLRKQLDNLRERLNGFLATEYSININNEAARKRWQDNHQPFHWFVEFYRIIYNGGFDVIIGNPPYLETQNVPYSVKFTPVGNSDTIHGMCITRSLALCKNTGCLSMIVPLSLVSSQRMATTRRVLEQNRDCWYSHFSWRPGKLFDTVNRALTIFMVAKPQENGATFSTAYTRWNLKERNHLIPNLRYVECPRSHSAFWVPKFGHHCEISMLDKLALLHTTLSNFMGESENFVFYRTTGGLYWKVFTDFRPKFRANGVARQSSREKHFALTEARHVKSAIAILSSDIFWWWYTITSTVRDLNPYSLNNFPVIESALNDPEIHKLGSKYITDLRANSTMRVRNQATTGITESQHFKIQKSKPIINKIDAALATHYGFDELEIDFLVNYDIKYRIA